MKKRKAPKAPIKGGMKMPGTKETPMTMGKKGTKGKAVKGRYC